MQKPWFDPDTGILLLDDYVSQMPSFQKVTSDSRVTDSELREQGERVVSLLKRVDSLMNPETREAVTDALCELTVLYQLQHLHAVGK